MRHAPLQNSDMHKSDGDTTKMAEGVIKGMVWGAIYHVAIVKLVASVAKRESAQLTPGQVLGHGAIGAIGGGLGAMAADAIFPGNAVLYHIGIIVGAVTYDHFLLM